MSNPFANLPAIWFDQVDVAALQTAVIQGFQTTWLADTGQALTLTQADRRYQFLLSITAYLVQEHMLIDASAKQNLLPFASAGFLDNLAALYGKRAFRLDPAPALTELIFTAAGTAGFDAIIPQGTLVQSTANPALQFATTQDLVIPAGSIAGTVVAQCTTLGPAGNGLLIGDLITPIGWTGAFAITVTNDLVTVGGADQETDENYRLRIFAVTDSYSNAGSYGAYYFFVKSASSAIGDCTIMGPEDGLQPGYVLANVLLQNGVLPSPPILDLVYASINDDTIRPLTDYVTVAGPIQIPYSIIVNYWVDTSGQGNLANIQINVTAAVMEFIFQNKIHMGGSINPMTLAKMVMLAGASYCQIAEPAHTLLTKNQVGLLVNDPLITYKGLETDIPPGGAP
jgi:phage-related baseplate assembly protein